MIDTSAWKKFRLGDLFTKRTMKGYPKKAESYDEVDNGYHIYGQNIGRQYPYKVLMDEQYLHKVEPDKPILAYASSVGEIGLINENFYRSGDNGAFQGLFPIGYHPNLLQMQFVLAILKKEFETFRYDTSMQNTMDITFKLPATADGQPDWAYMETYMKRIIKETKKSLENLKRADDTKQQIDVHDWGEFRVGDLLQMQNQIELSPIDAFNNNKPNDITYPFYGQSSENNGIIDYYWLGESLLNNKQAAHCIMIHSNTHLAYYVNTPFYLKDGHGATTIFTNNHLTELTTYYVISVLNRTMSEKFDYDMKATKEKLKDLIIKLPITKTGEPDWQYMENYMKNIISTMQNNLTLFQAA